MGHAPRRADVASARAAGAAMFAAAVARDQRDDENIEMKMLRGPAFG
jgi:hypothetical protein